MGNQTIVWYTGGMAPRKEQLLDVAARVFSERGYNGSSMQNLAEGLGILRGSIYAHIDSKEDLLFDIVDSGADRFISRLDRVTGSASEKLRAAFTSHIETIAEHLEASTVFLNDWRFLSPDRRRTIENKRERYEQMVEAIIEQGIAEGQFRKDLDAGFAALMVLSNMNWVYQWYRRDGKMTPAQIADVFSEMVLNGFAPRGDTK